MAPTESAILENFLLIPSQLPAIIAPHDFTALFPRAHQSSPSVRTLYRDLQSQRSVITDEVAANIQAEARRSKTLRRAAVRTQREIKAQEYDRELERERMVRDLRSLPFGRDKTDEWDPSSSAMHPALRHLSIAFIPFSQN